jgi:hypothetical protein
MRQSLPLPIQTLMNEFLRIEANDLEVLTGLPGVLPIRSGEGVIGYAKIDREAYRRDLYALVLPDAERIKCVVKNCPWQAQVCPCAFSATGAPGGVSGCSSATKRSDPDRFLLPIGWNAKSAWFPRKAAISIWNVEKAGAGERSALPIAP